LYRRTKPGTLLKHHVPIRSERWNVDEAGWCETCDSEEEAALHDRRPDDDERTDEQ
jgi:hypothetical protein